MHTTRRFFALSLAAASAVAVLAPQNAAACQCLEFNWQDELSSTRFSHSDVIFRGRVSSIVSISEAEARDRRDTNEDEARGMHLFQFEVYDAFKGEVGERIEVVAPGLPLMCGWRMAIGDILLVRAVRDPALGLVTGACSVHPDTDGSSARYLRTLM
jgi:hypothetical protein